jgi:hypothetical protein
MQVSIDARRSYFVKAEYGSTAAEALVQALMRCGDDIACANHLVIEPCDPLSVPGEQRFMQRRECLSRGCRSHR